MRYHNTTAVVGAQKAKQQNQSYQHKAVTSQLPQLETATLSHHHDFLHDKAKQERDKNAQNIAQWEQQEAHHHMECELDQC